MATESLESRAVASGNVRRYRRGRQELIDQLGGKCADCGATEDLEFDHPSGRTWEARKTSRWQRLALYRREAKDGKIELRCKDCNKRRGSPRRKQQTADESDW